MVKKDKKTKKYVANFYYTDLATGMRKRKKKEGFLTMGEAKEYEENFLLKMEKNKDISFETLINIYLDDCKHRVKPTTFELKKHMINLKILPYFKEKKILDIDALDIRRWQNILLSNEKTFKPTYLKVISNQLNAIFNYAVRYYNLPKNPVKLCEPIGKKYAEEMLYWTKDEFFNFREKIKNKEMSEVIFNLLFYTGMREGELLALTFDDFDLKNQKVSINKTYIRLKGKDIIQNPKTPKSRRNITIPKFLCDQIKNFANKRYDYKTNERLFPITKYYLHHEIKRGSNLAGVKKIRVHDLRHSHVALLISLGKPILVVSERLGHDNPETTLRVYGHLYPNVQKEVADELNFLENFDKENIK